MNVKFKWAIAGVVGPLGLMVQALVLFFFLPIFKAPLPLISLNDAMMSLGLITQPFGIVAAIILIIVALSQKKPAVSEHESGERADKFSWGAILQPTVFAVGNGLFVHAALSLVPYVNVVIWLYLALSGRALAWEKSKNKVIADFKVRQVKIVAVAVVIDVVLSIGFGMFFLWFLIVAASRVR